MILYIKKALFILLILIVMVIISCSKEVDMNEEDYSKIKKSFEVLSEKRIFFGHQSVGSNIIDGIKTNSNNSLSNYKIISIDEYRENKKTNFIETTIGRNGYPGEKIKDFSDIMRSGLADDVDIAFMKFCYVDSNGNMSSDELFTAYIKEIEKLEIEFPEVIFVYVTMPLTGIVGGPIDKVKNILKNILGKPIYGRDDNVKRNLFNNMIRNKKMDTGRVFDLALIEATGTDGAANTFTYDGEVYYMMTPYYTNDGGHLNEIGRQYVSKKLLFFLASLFDE